MIWCFNLKSARARTNEAKGFKNTISAESKGFLACTQMLRKADTWGFMPWGKENNHSPVLLP